MGALADCGCPIAPSLSTIRLPFEIGAERSLFQEPRRAADRREGQESRLFAAASAASPSQPQILDCADCIFCRRILI
jgi:hypothetical protein